MKKTIAVIISIALILISLAYSIEINAYDLSYYQGAYEKYEIQDVTGKTEDELLEISEDIILYLKNEGGSELLEPHFNEREVLHMVDVQDLFKLKTGIKYLSIVSLILGLAYYINKKETLYLSGFIVKFFFGFYALVALLVGLVSLNFSKSFIIFHHMFFDNDLWLLDPRTDLMIQMLPEGFFLDIAVRAVILFIIILLGLQALIYGYYRYEKKKI